MNEAATRALQIQHVLHEALKAGYFSLHFQPKSRGSNSELVGAEALLRPPILGQFDYALVRWTKRKYKRLGGSPTRARAWLKRVVAQQLGLFVHWHITYTGMVE